MDDPTLTVVIVTFERLPYLQRCLTSLEVEAPHLHQVVVVDASAESAEHGLSTQLPLTYLHAPELAGWMTRSRNRGLLAVSSDIVAFLDDDVVVRPGWGDALRQHYAINPDTVAAAGRTCNGIAGEEDYGWPIGRLLPNGSLTEGFASITDGPLPVDHGIGANMSFRTSTLALLGGFRDDYPGPALREDTDIFLRIKRLGGVTMFVPSAVADHKPAPHIKGSRFDTRYKLYGRRNHMVLLSRHAGTTSKVMRNWLCDQFKSVGEVRGPARKIERFGVVVLGTTFGAAAVARERRIAPMYPIRRDAFSQEIRRALAGLDP